MITKILDFIMGFFAFFTGKKLGEYSASNKIAKQKRRKDDETVKKKAKEWGRIIGRIRSNKRLPTKDPK